MTRFQKTRSDRSCSVWEKTTNDFPNEPQFRLYTLQSSSCWNQLHLPSQLLYVTYLSAWPVTLFADRLPLSPSSVSTLTLTKSRQDRRIASRLFYYSSKPPYTTGPRPFFRTQPNHNLSTCLTFSISLLSVAATRLPSRRASACVPPLFFGFATNRHTLRRNCAFHSHGARLTNSAAPLCGPRRCRQGH